jgi:phage terminase large subunit
MIFDPNPLFFKMALHVSQHKNDQDKIIICNEGTTRSSKTWDTIHLIYTYCDHNRGKGKEIYIFRDTLTNCKDYTLKEFVNCFKAMSLDIPIKNPQKPEIDLFGNKLYFRGLIEEDKAEAAPSDFIFVNEMLDIDSYSMISGWLMRCREIFIADWNPKFTEHWAYDLERRPNAIFIHSTYKNNKHLQQSVINEIEGYDPSNPVNVTNGTADEYRYKVYAQGFRASPEGVVFKDITWINLMPDTEIVSYGLDFGETNETAIVENKLIIRDGKYYDLFSKRLFYSPTESSKDVIEAVKALGIEKHIWCDNNKPGWIVDMRAAGIRALATTKFPGSREYWISTIKRCNIHLVRDYHYKKEAENFRYRVVDGVKLSETIKKYDHLWSACGYSVVGDFRQYMNFD